MKFKTLQGGEVRIALLSGHVAVVGPEFEELQDRFHADAYALMCISEDMLKSKASDLGIKHVEAIVRANTTKDRLLDAIDQLVKANDLDSFSKAGVPKAPILSSMLGETVNSSQRDAAWYKYQNTPQEG